MIWGSLQEFYKNDSIWMFSVRPSSSSSIEKFRGQIFAKCLTSFKLKLFTFEGLQNSKLNWHFQTNLLFMTEIWAKIFYEMSKMLVREFTLLFWKLNSQWKFKSEIFKHCMNCLNHCEFPTYLSKEFRGNLDVLGHFFRIKFSLALFIFFSSKIQWFHLFFSCAVNLLNI